MPGSRWITLAQTDPSLRYLAWTAAVTLATVLLVVGMAVARRLARRAPRKPSGGSLTIEDLEKLLAAGQIDQAEFRLLRRSALGLPSKDGEDSHSSPQGEDDDEDGSQPASPPADDEQPNGAQ